MELGIVGNEKGGHRSGLVGRSGRDASDAIVKEVPVETNILGQSVHWVDEDRADDRADAVDRLIGGHDTRHSQPALQKVNPVEDRVELLTVDGNRCTRREKLGDLREHGIASVSRNRLVRLDVELGKACEIQRTNDELFSNFKRLDVEEDVHR